MKSPFGEGKKKSASSLSSEHKRLLEQQRELKRREEELNRRLKKMPSKVAERQRRDNEFKQINSVTIAQESYVPLPRRKKTRGRRPLRSEQRAARAKFLMLCLILAAIVILLLRAIPN